MMVQAISYLLESTVWMHSPLMMSSLSPRTASMYDRLVEFLRTAPSSSPGRKNFLWLYRISAAISRVRSAAVRYAASGSSPASDGTGGVELAHVVVEDIEFVHLEKGHGEVFSVFPYLLPEYAHVIGDIVSDEAHIPAAEISHAGVLVGIFVGELPRQVIDGIRIKPLDARFARFDGQDSVPGRL